MLKFGVTELILSWVTTSVPGAHSGPGAFLTKSQKNPETPRSSFSSLGATTQSPFIVEHKGCQTCIWCFALYAIRQVRSAVRRQKQCRPTGV